MTAPTAVQMIAVDAISVLNPRVRNRKSLNELVESVERLGLKKPITVAARADGSGFDLVCGQGRLEAFMALQQTHIPALVITATPEDCFIMSLVENLARRHHTPTELMRNIGELRDRGYSTTVIAGKIGVSDEYVSAISYLLDHGEERLLAGVDRGVIPPSIAMEIARAKDEDVQQALAEAYEKRTLPGNQVLAIRRIIEQRNLTGKTTRQRGVSGRNLKRPVSADALVRAYRKETERQKLLVRKAAVSQRRLLFLVNGLRRLLADEHFTTLLRAEGIVSMPRPLAERLGTGRA
ncbi:MAG: plasmid partitioning protein RepB C-terminal domain-containing protein [Vicinamibacterales bacterium]